MKIKSKPLKDFQKNQIQNIQLKSIKGGCAIEKIEIATEKIEVVL